MDRSSAAKSPVAGEPGGAATSPGSTSAASTGSELDGFGAASGRALNTAGSSAPPGSDSTAAQTWLVQVFSFHADYIARDGGVRLPSGWEPLRIEATGGNKYRVYARKQEVAT